jgi:hypothetical protein
MAKRISIDPKGLLAWTTSTNYRISVTAGLVREVGNNKTFSPAVDSQSTFTSFSVGPFVTSTNYISASNIYINDAVVVYNRRIRPISGTTATYQLVSTSSGVLKTFLPNEVTYDGNKTVTIPFVGVTMPDGDYFINSDAGIWSDDFNFPNLEEELLAYNSIVNTGTVTTPIFRQTSLSNLDFPRSYISSVPGGTIITNLPFLNNTPQIIDQDINPSTVYTLTITTPFGTLNDQSSITFTDTKININNAISSIVFVLQQLENPDFEISFSLSKNGITLANRTTALSGTPFILGGTFTLDKQPTTSTYRHWWKNVPVVAQFNTSTIIDSNNLGTNPIYFNKVSKDGVASTGTITTATIANNSSTANLELSTGTYVIEAFWPGREESPAFYSKTSNQITLITAERNDYPGTLTLTGPASIYQLSLNKFTLKASVNTTTTGAVTFFSAGTAVTSTNFTGSTSTDIYAYTLGNTFSAFWEGQAETGSNIPYFPASSNTLTQTVITGTLTLSAPSQRSILDDCQITLTANTSSVSNNTVKLFNGAELLSTTSIPANTSSVVVTLAAGVLPLTTQTTITVSSTQTFSVIGTKFDNFPEYDLYISMDPDQFINPITIDGYGTFTGTITSFFAPTNGIYFKLDPSFAQAPIQSGYVVRFPLRTVTTTTNLARLSAVLTTTNATVYSNTASVTVTPPTQVTGNISLSTSTYQNYDSTGTVNTSTISALVTLTGNIRFPTGVVTVSDTVRTIGTGTLVRLTEIQSTATITWNPLSLNQTTGTFVISASYPGDSNNLSTVTNTASLTIVKNQAVVSLTTSNQITTGSYTGYYLSPVSFKATFANQTLAPSSVNWFVNGSLVSTTTSSNGIANLNNLSVNVGTQNISVSYNETVAYSGSNLESFIVSSSYFPPIDITFTDLNCFATETGDVGEDNSIRYYVNSDSENIEFSPIYSYVMPQGSLVSDQPTTVRIYASVSWYYQVETSFNVYETRVVNENIVLTNLDGSFDIAINSSGSTVYYPRKTFSSLGASTLGPIVFIINSTYMVSSTGFRVPAASSNTLIFESDPY